jgi:hypothetical protein
MCVVKSWVCRCSSCWPLPPPDARPPSPPVSPTEHSAIVLHAGGQHAGSGWRAASPSSSLPSSSPPPLPPPSQPPSAPPLSSSPAIISPPPPYLRRPSCRAFARSSRRGAIACERRRASGGGVRAAAQLWDRATHESGGAVHPADLDDLCEGAVVPSDEGGGGTQLIFVAWTRQGCRAEKAQCGRCKGLVAKARRAGSGLRSACGCVRALVKSTSGA